MDQYRSAVHSHLIPDELLLWSGKPVPDEYLSRNCLLSCVGMIVLAGLALWTFVVLGSLGLFEGTLSAPSFDPSTPAGLLALILALSTVVLFLAGIYLTFGHYLLGYVEWLHVEYAITEDRVLVLGGLIRARAHSCRLLDITRVEVRDCGYGVGDITLTLSSRSVPYSGTANPLILTLTAVPDARAVYHILDQAAVHAVERC